jgi:hypothetical protein
MMKIIHLSKRIELQVECHLDNKVGSLSWKFIPFPMIGVKRFGKMIDDEVLLGNGDTSIYLMWLFFELTLVIDDKIKDKL